MIDKLSATPAGDTTDGYATGVPYTFGYYRELAPALLRVALLAGGIAQSTEPRRFRYCELGCGRGLTSNILAATHPEADFQAVDFDPAHIAEARALAQAAGLANMQFREASFEAFAAEDMPGFDFMVLHGVYSWVSAANRVILMRLIERRLKPGGIAYVSYNAQPGWSHLEPLRRLLWELVEHGQGSMLERVRSALAACCQMRDAGAGYFARNPQAGRELDLMQARGPGYIVHEHLNRHWQPQYHADMVSVLAGAGCRFGTSADLTDHLDALDLGVADIRRLRAITDPVHARTLKDFMVDRRFRRDIFVKGLQPVTLSEAQSWAAWQDQRLALAQPRSLLRPAVPTRQGLVSLDPVIHVPLLDALADGPRSVAHLRAGDARIAALSPATLIESLVMLMGSGHVEPCPSGDQPAGLSGQAPVEAAYGPAQRLNQAMLALGREHVDITHLAAPCIGGAVQIDRNSQRFLLAEAEAQAGGGDDAVGFVARQLGGQGARLASGGKVLQDPASIRAELQRRGANFREVIRPHLQRLGVVGAAPRPDSKASPLEST